MKFNRKIQISTPIVWFSAIFSLSMVVGLLAGKTVSAAFNGTSPEESADPAAQAEIQSPFVPAEPVYQKLEAQQLETSAASVKAAPVETEPDRLLKFNQHNLLILQVDNLHSSQPKLQTMWLAVHLPEMGQLMLLPLYPDPRQVNGSGLAEALQAITALPSPVTADGDPRPELLAALETAGLWWHHSLVLDQIALIELLGTSHGGASAISEPTSGFDPLQEVAAAAALSQDPEAYIMATARLYGQICSFWATAPVLQTNAVETDAFSLEHIKTNLPAGQAALEDVPPEQAAIDCQFPSLEPRP